MTLDQATKLCKLFNTSPNWNEAQTQDIVLELKILDYADFNATSLAAASILAKEYLKTLKD